MTLVPPDTVDAVLDSMRGHRFVSAAAVAVCADDMLIGLVTIERLLAAAPGTTVVDVMDQQPPAVAPGTDQERAAWAAVRNDEPSLAVVDTAGRFLGLVPPPRLLVGFSLAALVLPTTLLI